ncbi:MAG: TolC family protein [Bacteroidaceae bacterium]|nr:TolC family protein [Bacteroidaceae bacterium]
MRKTIIATIICCAAGNLSAQQHYTLKSCLETGLEKNYSIRMVRNEEQISKNNATLGNAGYLPSLDLSAGFNGNVNNTETETRSTGEKSKTNGVFDKTLNAGLNLNWTLFDGFKIQATYARLKELEQQGETQTRIAIEDFIAELTAEYYNYIQQEIRLKNFRYAMSLSKERLRIVEERYIVGNFSRLDLQQARVDYNADRAQHMKQQEAVKSSRIRLNELMANDDMTQSITINDSIIDLNTLLSFEELWLSTLNNNASLLKSEQSKKIAALDMKAVKSRNYPYLRLNAGYGYTLNKYEISATSRRDNWGLNFGVTMGFNLFDGNRRREIKNARIAIDNAQLQQDDLRQALKADLSNLWQAYQNNIEMLKLERENLIAAIENHEIASERYMLGNLSGIEMREAQKSLLDAEERILTAEYDTKMCEISLLQLSGKITKYLE